MNLWPSSTKKRLAQLEREADEAERRLAEARAEHARVLRLAAEGRQIKRANGFTEAVREAMGVSDARRGHPKHG